MAKFLSNALFKGSLTVDNGITLTNGKNLTTSNQFYVLASNYTNGIPFGWDVSGVFVGYSMSSLPIYLGSNGTGDFWIKTTGNTIIENGNLVVGNTSAGGVIVVPRDSAYGTRPFLYNSDGNALLKTVSNDQLWQVFTTFSTGIKLKSSNIYGDYSVGTYPNGGSNSKYYFEAGAQPYSTGEGNTILLAGGVRTQGSSTANVLQFNGSLESDSSAQIIRGFYFNPSGITGGAAVYAFESTAGKIKVSDLAGTGSRMVVADANGILSTQNVPTSTNIYNGNGTLTGNRTVDTSTYSLLFSSSTQGTGTQFFKVVNSFGQAAISAGDDITVKLANTVNFNAGGIALEAGVGISGWSPAFATLMTIRSENDGVMYKSNTTSYFANSDNTKLLIVNSDGTVNVPGYLTVGTTTASSQTRLTVMGSQTYSKSIVLDSTWNYQTSWAMRNGIYSTEFNLGGSTKATNEGGPGSLQISTYNSQTATYRYPITFFANANVAFGGTSGTVPTDNGSTVQVNGSASISGLAGSGSRMVVASSTGVLSTQAIPGVTGLQSAVDTDKTSSGSLSTGTTTVKSVSASTYTGVFFDYVVKNGTNVRVGSVVAITNGTQVEFYETLSNDLGNTTGISFSVDLNGGNIRLLATTTGTGWTAIVSTRGI